MKKNTIFWIAALFGLLHVSCNNQLKNAAKVSDYNFNEPTVKVVLPEILNEISGLVFLDSNLFACVQDEQGVVFIYDLNQKQIIKKIPFYTNGDYEGITKVNQTLFVLR